MAFNAGLAGLAGGLGGGFANAATKKDGFNFLDLLKGAGKWLAGGDAYGNSNLLSTLGTAGALYSGYQGQKAANKALNLQQDAYDFNKMLALRNLEKENRAEKDLFDAWNRSAFVNPSAAGA